jgi:hypothetical protein
LLTTREAARYLGIASGTLCNWRTRGQGPAWVCLGRAIRYTPASLQHYLQQQAVQPTPVSSELVQIEDELFRLGSTLRQFGCLEDAPEGLVTRYAELCWRRSNLEIRKEAGI